MPVECRQTTAGGKGNLGMFIERDPKVVAAGLPTAQHAHKVSDSLQHYLLKDEVDALISDAIIPAPKERPLPPLRKPIPLDMRHAGLFGSQSQPILRPQEKTKFENLANEFMETTYSSYWKAPLGKVKDPVPMLPEGFDILGTTFGKPTPFHGQLYDIVMPKEPLPDKTPPSKAPGAQTDRKYCSPAFNPDLTYGYRTSVDKRGRRSKCCLSYDNIIEGTGGRTVINSIQANFLDAKQPKVGISLAPNNNIDEVPAGFAFGFLKPPDRVPRSQGCESNTGVDLFRKCMKHLNTVRKNLRTRRLPTFFNNFYLSLKYYDKDNTGWLPKDTVYKRCGIELIRFDPALFEPLLSIWKAFDGSNIEYETFVRVINYRIPSPEIPKIPMFQPECLDYRTTYTEMVKLGQEPDRRRMAGLPSGRYFDLDYPITPIGCCAADRICLPEESDMRSCINPSILTQCFVDHRDMYQKQDRANVRRVFEATGEDFSDERFNAIWEEAQKYHSQGWVCYETFHRAWKNHPSYKAVVE